MLQFTQLFMQRWQSWAPLSHSAFSQTWSVLGPFQIGTREAAYGADPLHFLGGFHTLDYDPNATFASSLAANATVSWSNFTAELPVPGATSAGASLDVSFPHIEWQSLRDVYGWAALQWQAWARGEIDVQSDDVILVNLWTPQVLEFWVDDVHYFGGDFYSYQTVPATLRLAPGIHRVDVRLVRDVRAMGGVGEPDMRINLELWESSSDLRPVVHPPRSGVLISDYIGTDQDAILASPHASVILRNDGMHDITVHAVDVNHNQCFSKLTSDGVSLVPGQSRPVGFRIECVSPPPPYPTVELRYTVDGSDGIQSLALAAEPELRTIQEPHKVTFLNAAGGTSYAMLRPPSRKALRTVEHDKPLPVILVLHGAGVEAESESMRHTLDALPDVAAWTLFPTGGTSWSGDDWHAWGFADVEAAVAMIPAWIENTQWTANRVDTDKWLVIGHSNGGQGTWYALTHRPDKVVAAAPLSGYSSIQNYVPYTLWQPTEPGRTAILQSSLATYRHEMLLANAKSIPVFQQHGGADDNVPPYHSRLMSQLILEADASSQYVEFPREPHYWDGVFTTQPLREFIEGQINVAMLNATRLPPSSLAFSLVVANPGDTGSKYGVKVLQLRVAAQLGRIDVLLDPVASICKIETTNVFMFGLSQDWGSCELVMVDGQELTATPFQNVFSSTIVRTGDQWKIAEMLPCWRSLRSGRQYGAMDAILRTHGAFSIVHHTNSSTTNHIALQISRNLCQYFSADTEITSDYKGALNSSGNIISIAIGNDLPPDVYGNHPIQVEDDHISLRAYGRRMRYAASAKSGLAAIYLRALPDERLELVVWGIDEQSLPLAARMVPMMTGSGQPDFVIADRTMLWKGIDGTLALGFYDHDWEISKTSFLS
ncbi:hypothetical protein DOTSEDRAFT_69726 [Lecanosticta acicola]|uniref:Peptidase S9 prolyl oligopeptidase catalytic domain-containing protein n=1 Tax=Lecanosticta acicola TaxID=111012 RepID=A0AAI8Z4S0_9PEZI|nr:hypothetical protein DOTSEDRAFT_69726 [Lecanosticta acicola]